MNAEERNKKLAQARLLSGNASTHSGEFPKAREATSAFKVKLRNQLSRIHSLHLNSTLLSNGFLLGFIELAILLQQFVFVEDPNLFKIQLLADIKSAAQTYFALSSLIATHRSTLVWSYLGLLLLKLPTLWYALSVFKREGHSSPLPKSILHLLFLWHTLEFSLLWIPLSLLVTTSIVVSNTGVDAAAGFGVLLLLGAQKVCMRVFEEDYELPSKQVNGMGGFLSQITRPVLDFALLLIRAIMVRQVDLSSSTRFATISFLLVATRLGILGGMLYGSWYPYFATYRTIVAGSKLLILVVGSYELVYLIWPPLKSTVEVELLLVILCVPLLMLFTNLSNRRLHSVKTMQFMELRSTHHAEIRTNHLVDLYSSSIEEGTSCPELTLSMSMHVSACRNSYCLCRLLHTQLKTQCFPDYEEKKMLEGYWRDKLSVPSIIRKLVFLENKESVDRAISDQQLLDRRLEDLVIRETLKTELKHLEREKRNVTALTKQIHKRFGTSGRARQLPVVDGSSPHFPNVLFGFLVEFADKQKSLDGVFLAFRYCLEQLQNHTLVLLRGYNLQHSKKFSSRASVLEQVKLANYLDKAQQSFQVEGNDSRFWLAEVTFSQVLQDIKDIDYCGDLLLQVCQIQSGLLSSIQKKDSLEEIITAGNEVFSRCTEFDRITGQLINRAIGSRKLLMLKINYKLHVTQESKGIKSLIERYQKFTSKRKSTFGLDSMQKKHGINFLDQNNLAIMHKIKPVGLGVVYYTRNTPKALSYAPEKLEGLNIKELLPGKLKSSHDDYIVDYLNCRKNDSLAPFAISGFMIDGKNNSLLVNNLAKVEVLATDHIFIASLTTVMPSKKGSGLAILDDQFSLLSLNQSLKTNFQDLEENPGKVFYRVPLLIELARNCLGLHKAEKEKQQRVSEIIQPRSQEFFDEMKDPKMVGGSTPMIKITPILGPAATPVSGRAAGTDNFVNLRDLLKVDGSSIQNLPSSSARNEPLSPQIRGDYADNLRQGKAQSSISEVGHQKGEPRQVDLKTLQNDLRVELDQQQAEAGIGHDLAVNTHFYRANFEAFYLEIGKPKKVLKHEGSHAKNKIMKVVLKDSLQGPSRQESKSASGQEPADPDLGVNPGENEKFLEVLMANYQAFLDQARPELEQHPVRLKECSLTLTYCRYKPNLAFYAVEIKNVRPLEHRACKFLSKQLAATSTTGSLSTILMVEVSMFKVFCRTAELTQGRAETESRTQHRRLKRRSSEEKTWTRRQMECSTLWERKAAEPWSCVGFCDAGGGVGDGQRGNLGKLLGGLPRGSSNIGMSKRSVSLMSNSHERSRSLAPEEKLSPGLKKQVSALKDNPGELDREKTELNPPAVNAFLKALRDLIKKSKSAEVAHAHPPSDQKVGRSETSISPRSQSALHSMKGQMYAKAKEVQELMLKVLATVESGNPLLSAAADNKRLGDSAYQQSESCSESIYSLSGDSANDTLKSGDMSLVHSVNSSNKSTTTVLNLKFKKHIQRVGLWKIFSHQFSLMYSFYVWALLAGVAYVSIKAVHMASTKAEFDFGDLICYQMNIYASFVQTLLANNLYLKESSASAATARKWDVGMLSSRDYDLERYAVLKNTYLQTVRTQDSKAWTTTTRYFRSDGVEISGSLGTEVLDVLFQFKKYLSANTITFQPSPPIALQVSNYFTFLTSASSLSASLSSSITSSSSFQTILSSVSLGVSVLLSAALIGSGIFLWHHVNTLWSNVRMVLNRFSSNALKIETLRLKSCLSMPLDCRIHYPRDLRFRKKHSHQKQVTRDKGQTAGENGIGKVRRSDKTQFELAKDNERDHAKSLHDDQTSPLKNSTNENGPSFDVKSEFAGSDPEKARVTAQHAKAHSNQNKTENLNAGEKSGADESIARRVKSSKHSPQKGSRLFEDRRKVRGSNAMVAIVLGIVGLVLMNLATIVDMVFGASQRQSIDQIAAVRRRIAYVIQYGKIDVISTLALISKLPDYLAKINQNAELSSKTKDGKYGVLLSLYTELSNNLGVGFFQNPLCTSNYLAYGLVEKCTVVSQGFTGYTLQNAINGVDVVTQDALQALKSNSSLGFLSFDNLFYSPITTDILDQRLTYALQTLANKYENQLSAYLLYNLSLYMAVLIASLILLALLNHLLLLKAEFRKWKWTARTFSVLPRELLLGNSLMKVHFERLIVAYL